MYVLRRIFGPKRHEVTGEWRKIHNQEINPLNAELNPICHLLALLGAHHILNVSRIRFNDPYSSLNTLRVTKSRRMRWARHVARMAKVRDVCGVLMRKPEGRRRHGRPKHRWEDNIKVDLQEVGYGVMDWIELARDRDSWRTLVTAAMNLRVP